MKNLGVYPVFIGGYKVNRSVKMDDKGKYYCQWYGDLIELIRGMSGYFHSVGKF